MQCGNNLKQLGLAMHNYHDVHRTLPYASGDCCGPAPTTRGGVWSTMILPYLEAQNLHDLIDFNKHVNELPATTVTKRIETYVCPSDPGDDVILTGRYTGGNDNPPTAMGLWYTASMGPTAPDSCPYCPNTSSGPSNYCCQGNNFGTRSTAQVTAPGPFSYPEGNGVGMFMRFRKATRFADVRDGLSKTIMLGETLPRQCVFISAFSVNFNVSPTTIPINTFESDELSPGTNWGRTSGFKSQHPGGATFCLGDGSVHFVSGEIDYKLYNELGTRAGAEQASLP